jgi:hypothetical protein
MHMRAFNGTQTWTKNIPQGTHRISKGGSRKIGGYHKAPQLCLLTESKPAVTAPQHWRRVLFTGCVKTRLSATATEQMFFKLSRGPEKFAIEANFGGVRKIVFAASQFFAFLHSLRPWLCENPK